MLINNSSLLPSTFQALKLDIGTGFDLANRKGAEVMTVLPWQEPIRTKISSVQSLSCVQFFVTPWTAARQASVSITNSQSLLKVMSVELVMPSNHLILCCPLLRPSIFPRIRVFFKESVLRIRWPKYWSFSFSISPSSEYSGLISGTKIGFPSPFSMLHWLAMFQMVDTPPACVPQWGWWGCVKLNICHVESCDLGALCYNSWPVGKAVVTLLRWKKI